MTSLLVVVTALLMLEALRRRDGALLAVAIFLAEHFTFRAVVLGAGMDAPYPSYLFGADWAGLMGPVDLLLITWVGVLFVGSVFGRTGRGRTREPHVTSGRKGPANRVLAASVVPIAGLTALMLVLLVVAHGGLSETERFVRLGNGGEGGTGIFLAAPSVLAVVSITSIASAKDAAVRAPRLAWMALGLSWCAFLVLGSRTPIIASVVALGAGLFLRMLRDRRFSLRVVAAVIVLAVAAPQLAIGLRHVRDGALSETASANAQAPTLSQSINANYYDSLVLVQRDMGTAYGSRSPLEVFRASTAVIPKSIWPGKPEYDSVGKWLRRQYEPSRINGWPVGAPGDWFLTFGAAGVVIGGLLSAGAIGLVNRRAGLLTGGAGYELAMLWAFAMLPGGIDTELISRAVVWVLLPMAYLALVRLFVNGGANKTSTSESYPLSDDVLNGGVA